MFVRGGRFWVVVLGLVQLSKFQIRGLAKYCISPDFGFEDRAHEYTFGASIIMTAYTLQHLKRVTTSITAEKVPRYVIGGGPKGI